MNIKINLTNFSLINILLLLKLEELNLDYKAKFIFYYCYKL